MADPLLEAEDLTIKYRTAGGDITAVSDASFRIEEGRFFGFVGESGCGKTTLAKSIIGGLDDNGYVASGTLRYKGEEIQGYSERDFNRDIRWSEISYIPQSAMESLDPLERISDQAVEVGKIHTDQSRGELLERFRNVFEIVGLPGERITDYPHQFSGGMKQRVIIALALFLEPSLVIADEPTTALDVIMQDQIFQHLSEINEQFDTSLLLISHDISLVSEVCDVISVMHSGQLCEIGSVKQLYDSPRHPYTILLKEAIPDVRHPNKELQIIDGHPPEPTGDIDYCTFVDRCPWAIEDCGASDPPLDAVTDGEGSFPHTAACFREESIYREGQEQTMTRTER